MNHRKSMKKFTVLLAVVLLIVLACPVCVLAGTPGVAALSTNAIRMINLVVILFAAVATVIMYMTKGR